MDIHISRWILDFFFRQSLDDTVLTALIGVLPLPNADPILQKIMLLRGLQSEIAAGSVSTRILGLMEQIEELQYRDRVMIPESMKAAYCAVAVNCTLRVLESDGEDKVTRYFEAVKEIWKRRICKMERADMAGLVSQELRCWGNEIEEGVWDSGVWEKLLLRSKENDPLELVRVYVVEAWENLGPCFLELLADLLSSNNELREVIGSLINAGHNPAIEFPRNNEDKSKKVQPPRNHVAIRQIGKSVAGTSRGVRVTDNEELGVYLFDKYKFYSTPEIKKIQEALKSSRMQLKSVVQDPLTDAINIADTIVANMEREKENVDAPNLPNEELGVDLFDKYKFCSTPEIKKIQEALKSSRMQLKSVVQDPLPDAINFADTIVANMEREKENVDAANLPNDRRDDEGNNDGGGRVNPMSRPTQSLMEPNGTALSHEWDDSNDELTEVGLPSEMDSPRLPTPKRKAASPLKKYKIAKLMKRRKRKKWSNLEEDTLRLGVQKYGIGNWKLILNMYPDIFEERTEVDLKDKWRNMIRY